MAAPSPLALLLAAWTPVAGEFFDREWESCGMSKDEIEDLDSDEDYEDAVVASTVEAYRTWARANGKPNFDHIVPFYQKKIAMAALEAGSYGSYRGILPAEDAVDRALRKLLE